MNELTQPIDGLQLPDGYIVTTEIYFNREKSDEFINRIKEYALSIDRDISTKKGRDNVASIAYKIAQMKKPIELTGKALVEEQKKAIKAVDNERIRLDKLLDELKAEVRQPLTDFENKEKERVQNHENNIENMKFCSVFSFIATIENIESRINQLNILYNSKNWEEFERKAKDVYEEHNSILVKMLEDEKKKESDRLELERLRKEKEETERQAREEQIRIDAERKAKLEAEDKARIEHERVEREKFELEAKLIKAEQEKQFAIEAERKRIAERQAREEQERIKREADNNHRKKINNEALKALIESKVELNEAQAKHIIKMIIAGEIPHVSIKY